MSATLAVVAATYRSVGLAQAGSASLSPSSAEMTWMGGSFEATGELQVLRKFALAAARCGASDEAFDHVLTAASLVDAPVHLYRETLAALRPVCVATGRHRAATTIDWYLQHPTLPADATDAAFARAAHGEAVAAVIGFERLGLLAHAAHALERAACQGRARDLYRFLVGHTAGLPRALAALGAARLSLPSEARERALEVAIAHARRSIAPSAARGRDVIEALDRRDFVATDWEPRTATPGADRFRFVAAPPWIEPMLDAEARDLAQLCAPLLLARKRYEERVSPSAADFALRRVMITRMLALEVATASNERREPLLISLRLRVEQLGDERFCHALATQQGAAAA